MPISHKHKCIFVHIPKTGGVSITTALGICGTQIDRNRFDNTLNENILFGFNGKIYYQHLLLREIKKIVERYIFNSYFKFAFVRNPYSRIVSEYLYRKNINQRFINTTFREFIINYLIPNNKKKLKDDKDRHSKPQYKFITDNKGKIEVDFVGRFENIDEDFEMIKKILGLNVDLHILNKSGNQLYEKYYDEETKKIVGRIYQKDFQIFGYDL